MARLIVPLESKKLYALLNFSDTDYDRLSSNALFARPNSWPITHRLMSDFMKNLIRVP